MRYRREGQVHFDPEKRNSQESPICFDHQEGKWEDVEVPFTLEGGNSRDDKVRCAPGHHAPEEHNSHDEQARFAPEGGNSHDDQGRFALGRLAPVHLAPEGGNSHDEHVGFAPEGSKPVERFEKLDLGLVQLLWDPTQAGQGRWWVVTDCSA